MNNIKQHFYMFVGMTIFHLKKGNVTIKEGTESRTNNSEETGEKKKRDSNLRIFTIKWKILAFSK